MIQYLNVNLENEEIQERSNPNENKDANLSQIIPDNQKLEIIWDEVLKLLLNEISLQNPKNSNLTIGCYSS